MINNHFYQTLILKDWLSKDKKKKIVFFYT